MADQQTRTRDLLANERTFLAWLRTAATVMVLGLAIARFADAPRAREIAAGALLVGTGALGVFEGVRRQRRVERAIESDQPIPVGGAIVAAVVLVVAVVAALVLLLV
jgi:putative membrane protein